jgi:hypothetical protein
MPKGHLWTDYKVKAVRFLQVRSDQKIRPRNLIPRPDQYGARFTSDRAAISIYIATIEADVKPHPAVRY